MHPRGLELRSAGAARAFPSQAISSAAGSAAVLCELPMPAIIGDAAYSEELDLCRGPDIVESRPLGYSERYPLSAAEDAYAAGSYEVFVDRLLNETLYLVRDVLRVERPRASVLYWDGILDRLRNNEDDDPARHALVADLARTLIPPLDHVTSRPKKVLKRVRSKQRVQLVQEVDTHCLMDLARQPGSTMPEKAGPKQQILAVTRQETIDLLENRVSRHCCELLYRATGRYLKAHEYIRESKRKERVQKLNRASVRLPKRHQFAGVGRLNQPCRHPNYVLMQNTHYSPIWRAYTKLVRNEELRDSLWRWPRRMWRDRVGVYTAESVLAWLKQSSYGICVPMAERVVQAHPRNDHGSWLLADIMPGPFVVGRDAARAGSLYVADTAALGPLDASLQECSSLAADYFVFWISGAAIRVLPIYAVWPSPVELAADDYPDVRDRLGEDVLRSISYFNRHSAHVHAVGALLVHPDCYSSSDGAMFGATDSDDTTCWHARLAPDVSGWPLADAARYSPFNAVVGG